ncbi:hypothetical protein [Aliarcobacter butzleri]|uniref:hypothetical protein n=1 Tax=Aliarcobacter butzleri TaxID=28197 RepID=UPI0021B2724B|nr:hypothetical protein [Aliarcobacter butzleri]MCT7577160.1 hypothetical protein [Aliarcobacter butzleri]
MSASNEWTEWHLTKKGWEKGSSVIDFNQLITIEAPKDRLISYKYSEYQSYGFSSVEKSTELIWSSNKNEQIEKYFLKFGVCPQKIV